MILNPNFKIKWNSAFRMGGLTIYIKKNGFRKFHWSIADCQEIIKEGNSKSFRKAERIARFHFNYYLTIEKINELISEKLKTHETN